MDRLLLCCVLLCAFVLSGCDGEFAASGEKSIKVVPGEADAELAATSPRVTRTAMPLPQRLQAPSPTAAPSAAVEPDGDAGAAEHRGSAATPAGAVDPATKTLAEELHALGFTRVDPARPPEGSDAASMLVEAGHAYWFDVETGTFPNEHDLLLDSLAELISPTLAGVVFEEVAPEYDDDADANDAEGVYLLRAYVDGQLLETPAEDYGDWYDVDAVLRLLDAVLLERKASERFLLLDTSDQTAIIVAANAAALEAAIDAHLLTPGDPNAAEALGKGFEQRVLRSLQQGKAD